MNIKVNFCYSHTRFEQLLSEQFSQSVRTKQAEYICTGSYKCELLPTNSKALQNHATTVRREMNCDGSSITCRLLSQQTTGCFISPFSLTNRDSFPRAHQASWLILAEGAKLLPSQLRLCYLALQKIQLPAPWTALLLAGGQAALHRLFAYYTRVTCISAGKNNSASDSWQADRSLACKSYAFARQGEMYNGLSLFLWI